MLWDAFDEDLGGDADDPWEDPEEERENRAYAIVSAWDLLG